MTIFRMIIAAGLALAAGVLVEGSRPDLQTQPDRVASAVAR